MASNESIKQEFLDAVSHLQSPENPKRAALMSYLKRLITQFKVHSVEPLDVINQATLRGIDSIEKEGKSINNVDAWLRTNAYYIIKCTSTDPSEVAAISVDELEQALRNRLYDQSATQQDEEASPFKVVLKKRQANNQCYDETLGENILPLRMMLIPSGSFLRGSPGSEVDRHSSEGPQHSVTLSQFFMAKHPVTQVQWRTVAAMPPVNRELNLNPSGFKGDLRPVENISWYDAVEFCDRLTLFTNRQYGLPTEAEWEYACRAGTDSPFHFGSTITTDIANYCGQDQTIGKIQYSGSYGDGSKGVFREETTSVDQFEGANAFGLCNMHGNVFEWCQDHWNNSYEGCPIDGTAYLTDNNNAARVARGGSWFYDPRFCRSASRISFEPNNVGFSLGFRVCCSAPAAG